jgi:uncharacterized protein with von Willebrand factor type A (vWA) domain
MNTPKVEIEKGMPAEELHEHVAAVVALLRLRGLAANPSYQVAMMAAINLLRTELAPEMTTADAALEVSNRMAHFHEFISRRN